MTGADRIETKREGPFQKGCKLNSLVASHTRVWGSPRLILGDEVVHDVYLEALREVPNVKGNPELIGRPLGIHGVFDGAAASGAGPEGSRHPGERQVNPDNFVPSLNHASSRYSGVDSATHGRQDFHPISLNPAPLEVFSGFCGPA